MNKKTIFVSGATGGIGGAAAQYFVSQGHTVIAPVRSLAKAEAQALLKINGIHVLVCDVENRQQTRELMQQLKNDNYAIDQVFLAAGVFLWDDGFPGSLLPFDEVQNLVWRANYVTKENMVDALAEFYDTSRIMLEIVGSHAADFIEGHPFRKGETIYADTMLAVRTYAHELTTSNRWGSVVLHEPGLIDTSMARAAFTLERAPDIDWSKAIKPDDYILSIYATTEL
jgi:NAD(P)-dependent dehydrogenase (short-subunit alcohol dehydrogenase family)